MRLRWLSGPAGRELRLCLRVVLVPDSSHWAGLHAVRLHFRLRALSRRSVRDWRKQWERRELRDQGGNSCHRLRGYAVVTAIVIFCRARNRKRTTNDSATSGQKKPTLTLRPTSQAPEERSPADTRPEKRQETLLLGKGLGSRTGAASPKAEGHRRRRRHRPQLAPQQVE